MDKKDEKEKPIKKPLYLNTQFQKSLKDLFAGKSLFTTNTSSLPAIDPKEPGAYEKLRQRNIDEREKLLRDLNISQLK